MSDELDEHIDGFLASFRAASRPFVPLTEPCVECGSPATKYCENCKGALCTPHADSEQYEDVDVCLSDESCNRRIAEEEARKCDA